MDDGELKRRIKVKSRYLEADTCEFDQGYPDSFIIDTERLLPLIDEAKKDFLCRRYNITPAQITPEFMEALRIQAEILRNIKKEHGTVNDEALLWFFDWFVDSL